MRIKSPRTHETITTYSLHFSLLNTPPQLSGCGYGFACDKDGNLTDTLTECAMESYKECMAGETWRLVGLQYAWVRDDAHEDGGEYKPLLCTGEWQKFAISKGEVQSYTKTVATAAIGECNACGRDVHLHGFTNTCECGLDYNMSGQQLACRSQWGEETGESLADILAADTDMYEEEVPPTVRSQPSPTLPPSRPVHVEMV